ncbi:MAG: prolipoprotein diacylglyceryl transferase [Coriobacteriia bacterium]|nr:prolipoprotein diacylglyceryl transferase [Coriobacteriia bacterium]
MGTLSIAAVLYPHIDPVAFRLGPLTVRWYGLSYLAGFFIAALILRWLARRWGLGLTDDDVLTVLVVAIIGLIVGARLGYVFVYGFDWLVKDPLSVFATWNGGMSFHGGLVGMIIGGVVAARVLKVPWMTLVDLGSVGAPVGLLLGRLANFVNGELWGRVSDLPWAMVFPEAGGLPRHPSQLYEAAAEGVILLVALLFLASRVPPRPRGELFGWFLTGYGVFRTIIEFFREPDVGIGFLSGGITMGQLLSVPMVIAGIAVIIWARRAMLPQEGPARAQGGEQGVPSGVPSETSSDAPDDAPDDASSDAPADAPSD